MTVNVCSASNFQIPTSEGGIFLRFINFPNDWIFRELPKRFGVVEQKPPSDSLRNFEFRNFANWCHSHRIWWECFNQLWSDHSKSGKGFNKNLRKNKKSFIRIFSKLPLDKPPPPLHQIYTKSIILYLNVQSVGWLS